MENGIHVEKSDDRVDQMARIISHFQRGFFTTVQPELIPDLSDPATEEKFRGEIREFIKNGNFHQLVEGDSVNLENQIVADLKLNSPTR